MKGKPREFFNVYRPFIQSTAKVSNSDAIKLKVNNDIIFDQKLVCSLFLNYHAELDHVHEIQREELQSPDAHPSVGAIKNNQKVN